MTKETEEKDDIALSAYIDGALDATEMREIEARLEVEPALAARLEALRAANDAVRKDAERFDDVPMSDGLTSLLDRLQEAGGETASGASAGVRSNVTAFPLWRRAIPALESHRAIAASVALLGAFAVAQIFLTTRSQQEWSGDGHIASSSGIAKALNENLSGDEAVLEKGARFSARLSYRTDDGALCRVFNLSRADRASENIACKESDGWRIAFSVAVQKSPEAPVSEYETASSTTNETLERYLDAAMAGSPLTREEETTAINKGWTQP